jgi:hypothetical protein
LREIKRPSASARALTLDKATHAAVRLESDVDLTRFDLFELERRLRILAAEAVASGPKRSDERRTFP